MGCDIHMVVERKVDGKWIAIETMRGHQSRNGMSFPLATRRNYERFAKLAGVRGDGPEPLGIPSDLSETGLYYVKRWDADGHSHSFMPVREAAPIFLATEFGEIEDWGKKYPIDYYFNVDDAEADDCRIVFWFDN